MISGKELNLREMLLSFKVPPFLATMAIPTMWLTPGAIDPDNAAVIELIRAVQRGLRSLGYKGIQVNGTLDPETGAALSQISPHWVEKAWVQIFGDIINAQRNPDRKIQSMSYLMTKSGMGSYFNYQGPPPGPLPGPMVGLPPGPLGDIEFGHGITDPTNCVGVGATKDTFKALQRAINRVASKTGTPKADVDGVIGKGTIAAGRAAAVAGATFPTIEAAFWDAATCDTIAAKAVDLTNTFNKKADALGAAKSVAAPAVSKVPDVVNPSLPTTVVPVGVLGTAKKYLPYLLLAGAVAGVAIWYDKTQKKGRR